VLSNGELYFVCISERHADRDYYIKLCRITHAALTGKGFTVPAGRMKRINDRLTSSFGILDEDVPRPRKVVLAFPSYFELLLREKRYHHTQRITTAEDGSTVLTMTVPVDYELIKWVLSWMDDVTVVRPKALRDEIKGIADRLTWKYS
jgi:predicted DNA-binding transcriptional regulator YafY